MPKRHRDFQKRRMGYALGCLDRALEHALEVKSEFDEVIGLDPLADDYTDQLMARAADNSHAKYALLLHVGLLQVLGAQQRFVEFATLAWGYVPDRIERWTNTGQDHDRETGQ